MYAIRVAREDDADVLSELAFKSKAHWGYDEAFMERFRDELKIDPADLDSGLTCLALSGDEIAGFYSLYGDGHEEGKLTDLFVAPSYIGKGVGKTLWDAAIAHARQLGFKTLEIHSDPHAESFYAHMGAVREGVVSSGSIPGRELPRMIMHIRG